MNREEPPEMKKAALDQWVREQENCGELGQREIRQIQLQKLNALLKREKGRQGFYRNLPEHLASLEQLPELPLTTEEDLKRSGNGMVLVSQSAVERVRTQETSGTTGPAKRVFYTAGDNERTVSFFAAGPFGTHTSRKQNYDLHAFFRRPGIGGTDRRGSDPPGCGASAGRLGQNFWSIPGSPGKRNSRIPLWGLRCCCCLCCGCSRRAASKEPWSAGDACPAGVMSEIEKLLDSRLYPHYGSREMGLGGAVTCPAFAGMHLRGKRYPGGDPG